MVLALSTQYASIRINQAILAVDHRTFRGNTSRQVMGKLTKSVRLVCVWLSVLEWPSRHGEVHCLPCLPN